MKRLIAFISVVLVETFMVEATAQTMKLWKNGVGVYVTQVADVDSITFAEDKSEHLQMNDLVGTWKIVYSKGQETYISNGEVKKSWDYDVEAEQDCWVFTSGGSMNFMEYSAPDYTNPRKQGMWNEDGTAHFSIDDGRLKVTGSWLTARLLSLCDDEMVLEYSTRSDGNGLLRTFTETMRRINTATDVLRTEYNPDASQPEAIPSVGYDDVVGTWLITYEKCFIDGKETERYCCNVEAEKNYYVILPDGRLGFIENDDDGTWHLDGHEYIPYTIADGRMSFQGGRIIEYGKDMARIYVEYVGDNNESEQYIYTLRRISTNTKYINYEE